MGTVPSQGRQPVWVKRVVFQREPWAREQSILHLELGTVIFSSVWGTPVCSSKLIKAPLEMLNFKGQPCDT